MARTNTANPRKRSEATRQNLLEAAAEVFVECGYDGTTLAAVAHRASVTTGAIYSNFEGKESLLCEVLRTRLTRQNDAFKTALLAALDVDPLIIALDTEDVEPDRSRMHALLLEAFAAARRNPTIRQMLNELLTELADLMTARVRLAQERGLIVKDVHAPTLALMYLIPAAGRAFAEAVGMDLPGRETWRPILERFDRALRA